MDFLKKLGLIEDDKKPVAKSVQAASVPTTDTTTPGVGVALAAQGVLDVPSITQDIESQIHENPAFALFKEFEAALDKLKNVPGMNEPTRFIAAQATIGQPPAEQLIAALRAHAEVLSNAADRFQKEFVARSNGDIEALKAKTDQVEQKIQDLTKELAAATQDKTDLITAVQQRTVDLGKANVDFTGITSSLTAKYQDLANKVQQYLGVANGK